MSIDVQHHFTRNDIPALPASAHDGGAPSQAGGRPIPFFSHEPVYLEKESREAGRPIYKKVEMVKIVIPGDLHLAPVRKVTQEHRDRFPDHYAAFQRQEQVAETGTPIDHWGVLTQERRYGLKHMGIFTVEQIAELSDANLQQIGLGGNVLRRQAQAFIETQKTGAVPERLVTENDTLRRQVSTLTTKLEQLTALVEQQARKAGTDVTQIADPVATVKEAIKATTLNAAGVQVEIPSNFRELPFKALRDLADKVSAAPALNKADAVQIIEEYLGRKAAAA